MHRAETILATLASTLTGLAQTGANVQRGYVDQLDALPGLIIRMGADTRDDVVNGQSDREMDILVESVVRASSTTDTELNQIRAEVYAAIMAAPTLGLGYVIQLTLDGDEEPEQKDNTRPIVRQVLRYRARYRHSITSAEA